MKLVHTLRFVLCSSVMVAAVMVSGANEASAAPAKADFVFLIDATGSMGNEIAAVKAGLGDFVTGLSAASVDARFAVVLYGGAPELVQDFTSSGTDTEAAFDKISVSGAVGGFQNNHNVNPEAGLEAIRIVLGEANNNTLLRNNVGGAGPLGFRTDARKNLILVTDEDSDTPFYAANRISGQTSTDASDFSPNLSGPSAGAAWNAWQTEINNTADAVMEHDAFVNMLINANDTPTKSQYGDPSKDVSDPDFLNFDAAATLAGLLADSNTQNSLEAQILGDGLIGRAFNIGAVDTDNFIDNFFAAKIEEVIDNPVVPLPAAAWMGLSMLGGLGLTQAVRRKRLAM